MLGRDHGAHERTRKGVELVRLQVQSASAIQRAERAIAERDRVVIAVRNTVRAIRGELT